MAAPIWKFILANNDASRTNIGDVTQQARDISLDLVLNRPGSLSFSLPLTFDLALNVDVLTTCVKAYKNNVEVWCGPVFRLEEDVGSNKVVVTCMGWFEYLNHRLLESDQVPLSYSSQTSGTIIFDLLAKANAKGATKITAGSAGDTQTRTLSYDVDQNIGQEIVKLTEIDNGPDIEITPNRVLNIYKPDMGQGLNNDKPNVVFGCNWGPHNVLNVSRSIDSTELVNKEIAIGSLGRASATDSTSIATYGLFTEATTLTDVNDTTILAAYANEEIVFKRDPREIITFTPFPVGINNFVPSIFEDYNIGDRIYLTADYGRIQISSQVIRVFGVTITIDDNGAEKLGEIKSTAQ